MQYQKQILLISVFFLAVIVVFSAGCTNTSSSVPATPASAAATVTPQASATTTLSMVGVWTGTTTGYTNADGFRETDTPRYVFTDQKGQAFTGNKTFTRASGKVFYENLFGVISNDGTISIVGNGTGTTVGKFIGPNEIELVFLNSGDDARALTLHLTRKQI
ncbi:MAG: hypothetical protein WC586_03035 [Methanoregula sp.]